MTVKSLDLEHYVFNFLIFLAYLLNDAVSLVARYLDASIESCNLSEEDAFIVDVSKNLLKLLFC